MNFTHACFTGIDTGKKVGHRTGAESRKMAMRIGRQDCPSERTNSC